MSDTKNELSKGCICLVCGIPGSGKSYFAERVKDYLVSNVDSWNAYFVQFDEIVSIEKQKHLMNEEKGFKKSRQSFINACKLFLSHLIDTKEANQQFTDEETQTSVELILKLNKNIDKRRFVLFVEDNFYLRSMRYEFVKLAKHYNLGFAQLILHTSLYICLSRNESRVNSVPDEFIIKMNDAFEKPNAEKFKWELNTLLLEKTDCSLDFHNVCVLITAAMRNPFTEVFDDKEQREHNREINNDSVIHQFDCLLRRVIREEIKDSEACERLQRAEQLTKRKAQLLRQSHDLPQWFVNEILTKSGLENSNCKMFAKSLLYSKC